MDTEDVSEVSKESNNLALIVPQYTFDAKTLGLVKSNETPELSSILDRVSIENGVFSIEDADKNSSPPDLKDALYEDIRPRFIGDSRRIIEIYKALYENHAISNIVQLIGNSILIGDEMDDDILSPAQQAFLLESKNTSSVYYLTDAKPFLLEYSKDDEDLTLARISKNPADLNKVLNAATPSPPIIIPEHTEQPIPVEEPNVHHSQWDHVVIWSVDDYCCIMETDYPVVRNESQPATAIHLHNADEPFTEEEALKLYLNNTISSAQQVMIYNIADDTPKYVTLVKTEDIPFLPTVSSPPQSEIDVDDLNQQIHSLTSFLLEGLTEDGTYWLVKEEGNPVVRLINLAAATAKENTPKENARSSVQEMNWKVMATNMCIRYASLVSQGTFNDRHAHLQQQLLLHALLLLQDLQHLSSHSFSLYHHYTDLLIQLFFQLAESHCNSATAGIPLSQQGFRTDQSPHEIVLHAEKALDCYHTTDRIIDSEVTSLTTTSPTHSLISRVEKYMTLQNTIRGKIDEVLQTLISFNISHVQFDTVFRDLNTFLSNAELRNNSQDAAHFAAKMILRLHHTAVSQPDSSLPLLTDDWPMLQQPLQRFRQTHPHLAAILPKDPRFSLLRLSLSLLSPTSPAFASVLNEAGRYLQSKSFTGSFVGNPNYIDAAECYEEAYGQFYRLNDVMNVSVVLGNYAKLLRQPLEALTVLSKEETLKEYKALHWLNEGVDFVLSSTCEDLLKQSVLLEFCDSQLKFVRLLLATEEKMAGFVVQTVDNPSRVKNILEYCLNSLEMIKAEDKVIEAKSLMVQYIVLFCDIKEESEVENVLQYAESVFESVKDRDIHDAVSITDKICQVLLSFAKQPGLTRKQRIHAYREIVNHIMKCAPLFIGTNLDRKIDYFNSLKFRFQSMVFQVMKLVNDEKDQKLKESVTKRCRRCISIFKSDDFYFFFNTVEEETAAFFDLLQ